MVCPPVEIIILSPSVTTLLSMKYSMPKDAFSGKGGTTSGPEVIKLCSCSTQLSMKIFPLINVKMPTTVGILTFMGGKNSILGLSKFKK